MLGEAKWIAFEICEVGGFVRVERKELLDWCLSNVKFTEHVLYKKDAYKKIYQRKDRKDKITMLVLNDLRQLKSFEIINYKKSYIHPETEERLVI